MTVEPKREHVWSRTPAKYGDVLRLVADACDAALAKPEVGE